MDDDHYKDLPGIPTISELMVNALDARFPAAPPSIDDDERLIWMKAGQRSLVEWLITVHKEQQESDV